MKLKTLIIIILIIITMSILSMGTIYALNMNITNRSNNTINIDNNINTLNDTVKLISVDKANDAFIESFEVILNGHKNILQIIFKYEKTLDNETNLEKQELIGTFLNRKIFSYLNYSNIEENVIFNKYYIKNHFNEHNFKIIKGTDNKDYLAIISNNYHEPGIYTSNITNYIYLLNESLEVIKTNTPDFDNNNETMVVSTNLSTMYLDDINPWYNDIYGLCNTNYICQIKLRFVSDDIYYLMPVKNTLEERLYTINDNKLDYKIIKTYDNLNIPNFIP